MSKVDLHMHSLFSSDGELAPEAIVELAISQGMNRIAITDHNSVRAVGPAIRRAADSRLEIVPGVELDVTFNKKNFHLLGYQIDVNRKEFADYEANIHQQEKVAGVQMVQLFREATGIPVEIEDVLAIARDDLIEGETIAEVVLEKYDATDFEMLRPYLPGGEKNDMPLVHFYWDFFAQGKPAHVPMQFIDMSDAVKLIHDAGGIAVLAHPGQNLQGNYEMIEDIIAVGIDGIEVFSSYHDEETRDYFYRVARNHHLIVTCGSDFHGSLKPQIQIGDCHLTIDESQILKRA